MGLCCFYAGQYDLTLSCFERALMLADDNNMADVWHLGDSFCFFKVPKWAGFETTMITRKFHSFHLLIHEMVSSFIQIV